MFTVIIADLVLVLAGSVLLRMFKVTENSNRKILIAILVISFACFILWLDYRFIGSTEGWIISIIFIFSMFIEYFKPIPSNKKNTFNDSYRGD